MSDENDRDFESLQPESLIREIEKSGKGSAAELVPWLIKRMPSNEVMGVKLPGAGFVDPALPEQYKRFLADDQFREARRKLLARVTTWLAALKSATDADASAEELDGRIASLESLFNDNRKRASDSVRELEKTYRMLDGFFVNAQTEPGATVKVWVYNAHPETLMTDRGRANYDELARHIQTKFKGWSMRGCYGMLVMPGWLGDVKHIDRVAKLGNQNRLMVFTDAPDMPSGRRLKEFLSADSFAGLRGTAEHKRNIVLLCNYLVARPKDSFEDEDLYVPPSCHWAGLVHQTDLTHGVHQSAAGYKHGKLLNAVGLRFDDVWNRDLSTELSKNFGANAIVPWDGYCTVVGDRNLSKEDGYDGYSRVRTEDWILKCVANFCNYQAFQGITNESLMEWQAALRRFLGTICDDQGRKEITRFTCNVTSSPEERRQHMVRVDLQIEYINSARHFLVSIKDAGTNNASAHVEKKA